MSTLFSKLFGGVEGSFLSDARAIVKKINDFEPSIKALDDTALRAKTTELRALLDKGATLDDILPEAFAVVREAAFRTLGLRHFDVQLIGGIALHKGNIAEMRTGEGKTLVATLAAYLNALPGKGVHVVTVNDYLSKRDGGWMGQVYDFLGLTVGVINSQNVSYLYDPTHSEKDAERDELGSFKVEYEFLKKSTRQESYAADITYGTNNEFGFDYLRDNLATDKRQLNQREHFYALVDEIDSILIDEARTPLIIAGEAPDSEKLYEQFSDIANALSEGAHYSVDEKFKSIALTQEGITEAERMLGIDNIYTQKGVRYVHHLETAVRAKALFKRDKDYVVQNNEIIIVDSFTGRMQPGRRWNEGLHQAIEAKENVKIQKESRTVASITFQNYFRFYKKLSGMTGTAKTSEEEFQKVYGLDVISIPTHRDIKRVDHNDLIYRTEEGKWKAIARKVKELQQKGQPVLIGTVSVEKNELLSAYLTREGVAHEVLNAKNHEREGEIISGAGVKNAVVVATNMAGRGVDIKLGGVKSSQAESDQIKELGGLFVLGTERHEARRIDNQLRGRSGRQGDPGETQFYVSLEDELMRVFGGEGLKAMMTKLGMPEDVPVENSIISKSIERAQKRIEGFNFDSRKHTLEYDDVLNRQRTTIYDRRRKLLVGTSEEVQAIFRTQSENYPDLAKLVEEKEASVGAENREGFWETMRRVMLHVTDMLWTEHLETMDYSRSSVNLRAYGQREPLVEYKKEALRLFREMDIRFYEEVSAIVKTIELKGAAASAGAAAPNPISISSETHPIATGDLASEVKKVGRNDPCPCGSGKKYKYCHGK